MQLRAVEVVLAALQHVEAEQFGADLLDDGFECLCANLGFADVKILDMSKIEGASWVARHQLALAIELVFFLSLLPLLVGQGFNKGKRAIIFEIIVA